MLNQSTAFEHKESVQEMCASYHDLDDQYFSEIVELA